MAPNSCNMLAVHRLNRRHLEGFTQPPGFVSIQYNSSQSCGCSHLFQPDTAQLIYMEWDLAKRESLKALNDHLPSQGIVSLGRLAKWLSTRAQMLPRK